jgi:hypothetical protein
MSQFRYLIAFTVNGRQGATEMNSPVPIASMADIAVIQQKLRAHVGVPDVVVLGFSRFADESIVDGAR